MKCTLLPPGQVKQLVQTVGQLQDEIFCQTHKHDCSRYAISGGLGIILASYKTYALVYLLQLITNSKKFRQNPTKRIPKFIFQYCISVSFTAVDFTIMRRVMCVYHRYIDSSSKSLIVSNILGGLYLTAQSKNRQAQISLYALNKAIQTVYNCYKRRNPDFHLPKGEVFLFAFSMSIMCYHYFNNRQAFRPSYSKAFGTILKNV